MRVTLGTLAKSTLEERVGPDASAAINLALTYYVEIRDRGRAPVKFPKFLREREQGGAAERPSGRAPAFVDDRREIEVEVDARIEAALCRDAERQGVSSGDLAGHAVLVYIAELDRVGEDASPARQLSRSSAWSSTARD